MKKQFIIAAVLLTLVACGEWGKEVPNGTSQQLVNTHADTLIFQVWMTDGYDRSLPVIGSKAVDDGK